MPAGHRIYTMFLYFSDVEEGGETDFPDLGISVRPKKGKVSGLHVQ
jgi:prolyl 4-hydroxylase